MIYLLSQFGTITPNTIAFIFITMFLLLVVCTHLLVMRYRARQEPEFPNLYLVVDNT